MDESGLGKGWAPQYPFCPQNQQIQGHPARNRSVPKRIIRDVGKNVHEVEKRALYYAAVTPELANAHQLRESALRCVERIPAGEDRVKYDNLFGPGDVSWQRVLD